MRLPMGCYVAGLVFCGLAFTASYLTQYRLYNESMRQSAPGGLFSRHTFWLWLGMTLVLLSLVAFALGSYLAVVRFR